MLIIATQFLEMGDNFQCWQSLKNASALYGKSVQQWKPPTMKLSTQKPTISFKHTKKINRTPYNWDANIESSISSDVTLQSRVYLTISLMAPPQNTRRVVNEQNVQQFQFCTPDNMIQIISGQLYPSMGYSEHTYKQQNFCIKNPNQDTRVNVDTEAVS